MEGMPSSISKERFHSLDLLRGFFIIVIICDHLSRWPSLFAIISGKALLWVTAAEGFVIISGLLVGYIRGYKAIHTPLREVTVKLWRRALLLYLWAVIGSVAYTAILWYTPLIGGSPGVEIDKGDWYHLITESITLHYTFVWVHFLKLYAIFLAASPLVIWLLRKGWAWMATLLTFAILVLGWATKNEVLQWQFIFFIPVIAGYYMSSIRIWWQAHTKPVRAALASSIIITAVVTVILSILGTFYPSFLPGLDTATVSLFAKDSISLLRAIMAFLWFTALLLIFNRFEPFIKRWLGWLLMPIGTHSLTAYILHGAVVIIISYFFVIYPGIITNSLLDILAILLVWALIKIPGINKVIPR